MKRFFLSLFFAAGVLAAADAAPSPDGGIVSLPPESLSVATGEVRRIEMPFPVTQYKSSTENVRIANASGRSFDIEGVTAGNAVVTVSMPGMNKEFRVTVSSSVMPLYRELCRELSDLPELCAGRSPSPDTGSISAASCAVMKTTAATTSSSAQDPFFSQS